MRELELAVMVDGGHAKFVSRTFVKDSRDGISADGHVTPPKFEGSKYVVT